MMTTKILKSLTFILVGASTLLSCSSNSDTSNLSIEHHGDSLSVLTITAPKRYILLPIQETANEALVKLHTASPTDVYMDIRLAVDSIDYFVPMALPTEKASAQLHIKGLKARAMAWEQMKTADTFDTTNTDYYRPLYHHTAPYGWMNDPNGLVYKDGEYHLYYQYNPYGSRWGNMHWGHSVSKDLIHWEHLAPAIARDTLGHIFSGSTIVDNDNNAGFGAGAILAFYTSHQWKAEGQWQAQSMAYSTDNGRTFTKYKGNPILTPFDGKRDFRDPKVFWYAPKKSWYMIVSADVEMRFYESKNLKEWKYLSSFGQGWGAQPNQFECPDFFEVPIDGNPSKTKWVMLVNINPGSPFGGSATEYFVGDFDGTHFTPSSSKQTIKWLDWGKDHYAAVTFSGIEGRVLAMPWTSNWQYANFTPIRQHRGANGLPRELSLYTGRDGELYLKAGVPQEMLALRQGKAVQSIDLSEVRPNTPLSISNIMKDNEGAMELNLKAQPIQAQLLTLTLSNELGEKTLIYIDKKKGKVVMDRSHSGITDFGKLSQPHPIENHDRRKQNSINYINDFALGTWAPLSLTANEHEYELRVFVDKYTIELFVDGGRIAMTNQVFPRKPYNQLTITADRVARISDLKIHRLGL